MWELHDEDTHCLTPGDGATRWRALSSVCTQEAHDGGRVFGSPYHDPQPWRMLLACEATTRRDVFVPLVRQMERFSPHPRIWAPI